MKRHGRFIKGTFNIFKISIFHNWITFNATPIKIGARYCFVTGKPILKFIWKGTGSRIAKTTATEKELGGTPSLPNMKAHYIEPVIKATCLTEAQTHGSMDQHTESRSRQTNWVLTKVWMEEGLLLNRCSGVTGHPKARKWISISTLHLTQNFVHNG